MCGLVGFLNICGREESAPRLLSQMLDRLKHRGPDHEGYWSDGLISMGHRRLSILDLSSAGNQPMVSNNGRYVIVFNGEIYNHLDIRKQLEGIGGGLWKGHSDTETLLAAVVAWGIESALSATVGMFAIALWDRQERSLTLARDRMGEKPLYYGWQSEEFLFGSELKALTVHPAFEKEIDWGAVNAFLHCNYVPSPYSIYRGIKKLPPGMYLRLSQRDISHRRLPMPKSYWSLGKAVKAANEEPFVGTFDDAVDELEYLVTQSVKGQCLSDVPVGAFLSGGIDSSLIVGVMQRANLSRVTTFAIGMEDPEFDEAGYAREVSNYLGTSHVQHVVGPAEILEVIQQLPKIWDEPLGDSSQIPTYILSALAKKSVSVALSGDGGDELFLGYAQYPLLAKFLRAKAMGRLPWGLALASMKSLSPKHRFPSKAQAVVGAWRQRSPGELSRYWMDLYRGVPFPMANDGQVISQKLPLLAGPASNVGAFDASTYLPDDIMTKVDRAAMAVSLETRAPLLDHRVVEFALKIPESFKLVRSSGKLVLKEVLYRYVPRKLVDRPKRGFSLPMSSLLKNQLRPWAESALDSLKTHSERLDQGVIGDIWKQHLSGDADRSGQIWGLLVLSQFLMSCGRHD